MKKIIKKLGVIGLLLAVLIPFMSFPKVNAANDGECKTHLQNYLFLDVEQLQFADSFEGFSGGYTTATHYPFEFDRNAKNIKITYKDINSSNVSEYLKLYNYAVVRNNLGENGSYGYTDSSIYGNSFTNKTASTYATNTILIHGKWSSSDREFEPISNNWEKLDESSFPNYILQSSSIFNSNMNVSVGTAKYQDNGQKIIPNTDKLTESYLQEIVSDPDDASDKNLLFYDSTSERLYIPISITRTITGTYSNYVNGAIYGYVQKNTNGGVTSYAMVVFGKNDKTENLTLDDVKSTKNSYKYYSDWVRKNSANAINCLTTKASDSEDNMCYSIVIDENTFDKFNNNPKSTGIDFNVYGAYYWPYVMNVEYETCTTSNDPEEGNWNLIYDANANGDSSVTNVPDAVNNISFTSKVKIENGPSRDGYKFSKWCTKKDGTGDCYTAGVDFKNENQDPVVTLYAQWGKTGTTNNSKTGIASYIVSFIAVGAIAGGIYYVSKKKNLFKQI